MLDERLTPVPGLKDIQSTGAPEFQPQSTGARAISLRCAGCGHSVEMAFWQPVVRCPHCQHLVYPDRSLRNLLPLGWDCPECHQANDQLTNFCVHCGAGLASRCLQCEAPVTGPVCLRCGEHQAHLRQLQRRTADRATWLPIQQERVQAQMAYGSQQTRIQEEAARAAAQPPLDARTTRRQERAQRRAERRSRRRGGLGWGWRWWLVAGGIYFMAQRMGGLQGFFNSITTPATSAPPALPADFWNVLQGWWTALPATVNSVQTLKPDDPGYSVLFAAIMIGLASLPLMLYVIDRTVKRLFP